MQRAAPFTRRIGTAVATLSGRFSRAPDRAPAQSHGGAFSGGRWHDATRGRYLGSAAGQQPASCACPMGLHVRQRHCARPYPCGQLDRGMGRATVARRMYAKVPCSDGNARPTGRRGLIAIGAILRDRCAGRVAGRRRDHAMRSHAAVSCAYAAIAAVPGKRRRSAEHKYYNAAE